MALPWASALVAFRQGHREGGKMAPGPMEMTLTNQFVKHRRSFFFFEITSKSGENCGILPRRQFFAFEFTLNPEKIVAFSSSFLEFTKPEMPNI